MYYKRQELSKMSIKEDALKYHAALPHGKIGTNITKPVKTQADLSLAYTPGVAEPCLAIAKDPTMAYQYTNKGNLVAVISNGTAVLGLGNIGALASKPVMEGKALLFKHFAGIDSFDIEVNETQVDKLVEIISAISPSFGGINLEDFKAPECFEIERRLKERLNIPVFHDDQHGTAVIVTAGLINALEIQGKKFKDIKIVMLGAGAASLATANFLLEFGIKKEKLFMFDTKGLLHNDRKDLNEYKRPFAVHDADMTLTNAFKGADVFIGLSAPNIVTQDMVKMMANNAIIFALTNPNPEILSSLVHAVRDDIIMATGRSDYPNQVNNALCFPYLFKAALETKVSEISTSMKKACAKA